MNTTGFTMIDNARIEQAHSVGPSAFLIYCAIARHTNDDRKAWPGIDRLAAMTGLARRTVQVAISSLRRAGWLVVISSPGHSNTYTIPPAQSSATDCTPPDESSATDCAQVAQPDAPSSAARCATPAQLAAPELYLRNKTNEEDLKKKTKRGCAAEVVFPSELSSDLFKEAWERWTAHRKEIKKTLTPSTTKAQLKKLAALGEIRAIAAIDQSIEAGWTGIFETKIGAINGKRSFPRGPGQRNSATAKTPHEF